VLAFSACNAAKAERVLIIDSWWSGDYAKNNCKHPACLWQHPENAAFQFEDQIMTQLTINPDCKGITYVRYHPDYRAPGVLQAFEDPYHWTLMIDYIVGHPLSRGRSTKGAAVAMRRVKAALQSSLLLTSATTCSVVAPLESDNGGAL
jgi:hypothetical protein